MLRLPFQHKRSVDTYFPVSPARHEGFARPAPRSPWMLSLLRLRGRVDAASLQRIAGGEMIS